MRWRREKTRTQEMRSDTNAPNTHQMHNQSQIYTNNKVSFFIYLFIMSLKNNFKPFQTWNQYFFFHFQILLFSCVIITLAWKFERSKEFEQRLHIKWNGIFNFWFFNYFKRHWLSNGKIEIFKCNCTTIRCSIPLIMGNQGKQQSLVPAHISLTQMVHIGKVKGRY